MEPKWLKAAEYAGLSPGEPQIEQMLRFERWLSVEAARAGGIGPNEIDRLDIRHLADSVLFASQLESPETVWDVGTGVGLPGIPLAILLSETEFVLIDKSGRRIDLLKRLIRILELENCQAVHAKITNMEGPVDHLVARASLTPEELLPLARQNLSPGGVAVVGGSWVRRPQVPGWTTKEIPVSVLDQTVWLLMMRQA